MALGAGVFREASASEAEYDCRTILSRIAVAAGRGPGNSSLRPWFRALVRRLLLRPSRFFSFSQSTGMYLLLYSRESCGQGYLPSLREEFAATTKNGRRFPSSENLCDKSASKSPDPPTIPAANQPQQTTNHSRW